MVISEIDGSGNEKELYSTYDETLDIDSLKIEEEIREELEDTFIDDPKYYDTEIVGRIYSSGGKGGFDYSFEIEVDFNLDLLMLSQYEVRFPESEEMFDGLWYNGKRLHEEGVEGSERWRDLYWGDEEDDEWD